MKASDISKQSTLYVVPYAHLDTQWRWEFPQTISEYLLKTMRVNFDYIDNYPHYVFNWTGANRYRLMKEYFPADYERMKKYVADGRWYPAGSSMEEGDVNLPSAEGIIRQILYGNTYFRNEFGKASAEYMLPDCFGFPASLPSILAHMGVKGFSTQKLSAAWQPAPKVGGPDSPEQTPEGIPFNVGVWEGPDGKSVIAALNPGGYNSNVYTDLSKDPGPPPPPPVLTAEERARLTPQQLQSMRRPRQQEQDWLKRIETNGTVTGVFADYHYVGTGDTGGATREASVKLLEAIVTKGETILPNPPRFGRGQQQEEPPPTGPVIKVGDGPVQVLEATADQMFNDITPQMALRMPRYRGDLELINHSAGSLTSQAYHKRWVVKGELLADAAEKSSVAASWMGGRPYPQQRLNDAWTLVLGGHFHDTAAGTATPRAYEFAWNDDIIALNQFASVLKSATEAVVSGMNTQGRGTSIVVYNPLNISREDVVEANVAFPAGAPRAVRVYDPDGREVPAQLEGHKVLFVAKVPSVGYSVYDVQSADDNAAAGNLLSASDLKISADTLENARYRVHVNVDGDVASIFDKSLNKELLSAPIRLAISNDKPKQWPAWNMDFDQEQAAPRAFVRGPARIRIKERGQARVSLEVMREGEGSTFLQTISLSTGDAGNRVEFGNAIDWKTLSANLKASFSLTATNENATYDWDIGTVQRPSAQERQFEVGSHRWIDLTDKDGTNGVTILTDCKNGSDKPDDHTIRLTLLRSPGMQPGQNGRPPAYTDQANQDWGHHEFMFGVAGHAGDWRQGQTDWQAYRLNDPLIAFATDKHAGSLGKRFSLMRIDNPRIRLLALKKVEAGDEVIVRMVELDGKRIEVVKVNFAGPIREAREMNGQEQPIGKASVQDGALVTSFGPYQPRTFAVRLGDAPAKLKAVRSEAVSLKYNVAAASNDDTPTPSGGFDGSGNAMPAEMMPSQIEYGGVQFKLGPAKTGTPNAMIADGQTLRLPGGPFNRAYILASSIDGDQDVIFNAGNEAKRLTIQDWNGFIGQWDTRLWKNEPVRDWATSANHAPWPPPSDWPKAWSPRYPEDYVGLRPGFVKTAEIGWYASHHHNTQGWNEPYEYSYVFAYAVPLPPGTKTLRLPKNDKVRVFAISLAQETSNVIPAQPLYDTLGRNEPISRHE
jgi:alpha-mannosidase